jgi:hypothetical protein
MQQEFHIFDIRSLNMDPYGFDTPESLSVYKVTVPPSEDTNNEDMTSDTVVFNMCKFVSIEDQCLASLSD